MIVKLGETSFIVLAATEGRIIQANCADVIVKVAHSSSFFYTARQERVTNRILMAQHNYLGR